MCSLVVEKVILLSFENIWKPLNLASVTTNPPRLRHKQGTLSRKAICLAKAVTLPPNSAHTVWKTASRKVFAKHSFCNKFETDSLQKNNNIT